MKAGAQIPRARPLQSETSESITTPPKTQREDDTSSVEPTQYSHNRQLTEYELEMWKQVEQEKFRLHLKQQEDATLLLLKDEWKRRDYQREQAVRKSLEDINRMELSLQVKCPSNMCISIQ